MAALIEAASEGSQLVPAQKVIEASLQTLGGKPRALSRPLFKDPGIMVFGTEDHLEKDQYIVACKLDDNSDIVDYHRFHIPSGTSRDGAPLCVSDSSWLAQDIAIFAVGPRYALLHLRHPDPMKDSVLDVLDSSLLHVDDIRSIAVSPHHGHVISGGLDGHVHVVDFHHGDLDGLASILVTKELSEIIGSVRWHPTGSTLASWTTDSGSFHLYDNREHKYSVVFHTKPQKLHSHAYVDDTTIAFGFGTGMIQLFDIRKNSCFCTMLDPVVSQIGEVQSDLYSRKFFAFGIPGFSIWHAPLHAPSSLSHYQQPKPAFPMEQQVKVSGTTFSNGSKLGCSTNFGTIFLYDLLMDVSQAV